MNWSLRKTRIALVQLKRYKITLSMISCRRKKKEKKINYLVKRGEIIPRIQYYNLYRMEQQ